MKKLPKFVLVSADDWEAFYVDGKCAEQGHHVQLIDLLAENGVSIVEYEACNDPYLESGQFPDTLSEVTFD